MMRMRSLASNPVIWMIGISAIILFASSSLRHELFQSTAFDLGIFDQATYLISQGQSPISTFMGYHILGDHAAWIWYPLALLYKIYPSVYWLFAIQAIALASGAFPTWQLALQAGLKESQAIAMAAVYLLYPLIFNINLFDFHPEVIALPLLLAAVLAARLNQIWWFCLSVFLILGCKAVLSFTVAAMGVWLMLFEKRRLHGAIAFGAGVAWFLIATKVIIPTFSGAEPAAVGRYSYLGNSVLEIAQNIIFNPGLILGKVLVLSNLEYLVLVLAPVIWGFSLAGIKPLIAAIPCLALNIIADYQPQKDLIHQYSLPALPFILLVLISSLAAGKGLVQHKRGIVIWSLIAFLCLAKYTHFSGVYLQSIDNWQATREAIALVKTQDSVLTTAKISPHLSHRPVINSIQNNLPLDQVNTFNYILLDTRHSDLSGNRDLNLKLLDKLKNDGDFKLQYQRDDVYLFTKI